jgi:hypothetical protein
MLAGCDSPAEPPPKVEPPAQPAPAVKAPETPVREMKPAERAADTKPTDEPPELVAPAGAKDEHADAAKPK